MRHLFAVSCFSCAVSVYLLCFVERVAAFGFADTGSIPGSASGSASETEEIGRIVCTPEDKHDTTWFKCIECCQSINCYYLKPRTKECNREARRAFANKADLDGSTRNKVCVGQNAYNLQLKEQVILLKEKQKLECETPAGMAALFMDKVQCFRSCGEFNFANAVIKKYCPTFKG